MVFSNLDMSFIIMFECSMSQIQLIKETPLQECSRLFLPLRHSCKNVCQDKMHKSNGRNTFATPSQFFSHSDSSSYIAHSYLEIEKDYLYQYGRIHYGNTLQELMVLAVLVKSTAALQQQFLFCNWAILLLLLLLLSLLLLCGNKYSLV